MQYYLGAKLEVHSEPTVKLKHQSQTSRTKGFDNFNGEKERKM